MYWLSQLVLVNYEEVKLKIEKELELMGNVNTSMNFSAAMFNQLDSAKILVKQVWLFMLRRSVVLWK